jgi:diguanylate cyclase (GGDEF)-like protein
MAASDDQHPNRPSRRDGECLSADALAERVEEEVARAERHATPLSCLLVGVEDLRTLEQAHGRELCEQARAYVGVALRREFRRFDRVGRASEREFLVVLPGADGVRGEVVARRALKRLRAIKIEVQGERRALRVALALATWRDGLTAAQLLAAARKAAGREPPANTPLPGGPLGFRDAPET